MVTAAKRPGSRCTSAAGSPHRSAKRPDSVARGGVSRSPPTGLPTTLNSLCAASSMADAWLPHVVASALPGVNVLFLDTSYHFPETYATRTEVGYTIEVCL